MAASKALTEEQEVEVYVSNKAGKSVKELADEFGVSPSTIDRAVRDVAARKINVVLANVEKLDEWEDQAWASMQILQMSTRIELAVTLHLDGVTSTGATSSAKLHDVLRLVAMLQKTATARLTLFVRIHGQYSVRSATRSRRIAPPTTGCGGAPTATTGTETGLSDILELSDAGETLDMLLNGIDVTSSILDDLEVEPFELDTPDISMELDELIKLK